MTTLIIEICDDEAIKQRVSDAMKGRKQGEFVSFSSIDLMHKVMTPRRWDIIHKLQLKSSGLRALSREMGLDAGNLQRDIKPLKEYGIVQDIDGQLTVPYHEIRMQLVSRAA